MAMLELFWDVVSPYTYLAVTQIDKLRQATGAKVKLRPFLLGGVFKNTGNVAPAALPAKATYLRQDLARWAKLYDVPLRLPPNEVPFPINGLLPMRAAIAAERDGGGEALCRALFRAYWVNGHDVSDPATLVSVAHSEGMDGDSLLALTQNQAIKDALRANTDEAVARGAFGAPAMFIDEQHYWGNDRLPLIESHLRQLQADAKTARE